MGLFQLKGEYTTPNFENKAITQDNFVVQGIVKKVYLEFSTDSNGNSIPPGTIEVNAVGKNKSNTLIVYPYDALLLDLPLESEVVDVFYNGSIPTYRRLNLNDSPNNGGFQNPPQIKPSSGTLVNPQSYKSGGGFIDALKSVGSKLGSYFKGKPIHRLKLYEGDTIIQSKFGQSIRLSGFNNSKNDFNPKIIIRNKEATKFESIAVSTAIEEDLNRDGSTILMSSGGDKINFIPGTPDLLGGSDFKNRPDKSSKIIYIGNKDDKGFEAYPSKYEGEQCFITSDRLIFSSRKNEMIFWSKGHYGVITDGIFSVDSELGININSKGNIDIQSFDKEITLYIGDTGTINLGNKNLKPAVDGTLLVEILGLLIKELLDLRDGGLLTPSGPVSGMNPTNEKRIKAIGDKVSNLLSSRVKIQM